MTVTYNYLNPCRLNRSDYQVLYKFQTLETNTPISVSRPFCLFFFTQHNIKQLINNLVLCKLSILLIHQLLVKVVIVAIKTEYQYLGHTTVPVINIDIIVQKINFSHYLVLNRLIIFYFQLQFCRYRPTLVRRCVFF